jgi:hypothetical protein
MTRPFTAVLFGGASLLGAVWWALHQQRPRTLVRLGAAGVAGCLPFVVMGAIWVSTFPRDASGHRSLNAYALYDPADTLGFGADKGKGWLKTWGSWGHSPGKALRSVRYYLSHTSHYLLGWPWRLSLMLVPVPLLLCRHRGRYLFLLAVMLALVGGHMFYWATQHIGYGARYWFAAVPLAVVLSGIGLDALTIGRRRRGPWRAATGGVLGVMCVAGLILWNATVYMPKRLREARGYGNVSVRLQNEVRRMALREAVVFVPTEDLLFNDGFFMNDPLLRHGPFFARDLGARNMELAALFPGCRSYAWNRNELRPLPAGGGGSP